MVWVADSLVVQVMVAPVWVIDPAVRLDWVGGVVSGIKSLIDPPNDPPFNVSLMVIEVVVS